MKYLANAYRVAGGNHDRAVALYAGGYYYAAKRRGMLAQVNPNGGIGVASLDQVKGRQSFASAEPQQVSFTIRDVKGAVP